MAKTYVKFAVVKEIANYIATKIGYCRKGNMGKGTPSPRLLLHNMGVLNKKTYERAQTSEIKGGDPVVSVSVRNMAVMFGESSEDIHSVREWVEFAKTMNLSSAAKAIILADEFLRVAEDEIRLDRVQISVMEEICGAAGIDDMLLFHYACTGRAPRGARYWALGDYKSKKFPEEFLSRNLQALQAMAERMGKRVSFKAHEDATQEMWQLILYYGGWIVTMELTANKSDSEILSELGGYMKSVTEAVRGKISDKHVVSFEKTDDYREDSDRRLTAKGMDTEMSAMLRSQTLQDLCDEYGVSPEKAILLIKKRLGLS